MSMSVNFRQNAFGLLVLPHLENPEGWDAHGIGKISKVLRQKELFYDELRLHIWNPDIIMIDRESGAIHNHNHDFEALLVAGTIKDQGWIVSPTTKEHAEWELWEHRTPDGTVKRSFAHASPGTTAILRQGDIYSSPSSRWHLSTPDSIAITLLQRTQRGDGRSFAIAKTGKEVVDGLLNSTCEGGIEATLEAAIKLITK